MNTALRVEIDNSYAPSVDITPSRLFFQDSSDKRVYQSSLFYRDEYQPDLTYSLPPQQLPSDLVIGDEQHEHDVHAEWLSSSPASSPLPSSEGEFSPGYEGLDGFFVEEQCHGQRREHPTQLPTQLPISSTQLPMGLFIPHTGLTPTNTHFSMLPQQYMGPTGCTPTNIQFGMFPEQQPLGSTGITPTNSRFSMASLQLVDSTGFTPTNSRFANVPQPLMLPPSDVQTWYCATSDPELARQIRACVDASLSDTPELELEEPAANHDVEREEKEAAEQLAIIAQMETTPFMQKWISDAKLRANAFWWRKTHTKCSVRGCTFQGRNNWESRLHADKHPEGASRHLYCKKSSCIHSIVPLGSVANLRRHERLVHENTEKVKCSLCNRTFGRQDSVRRHQVSRACSGWRQVERRSRANKRIYYNADHYKEM